MKKSADGYEAIRLLMVLSTTAWMEMLERWYAMPVASTRHLPMVCNLNSLELRCMGKLVQEEHKYSTTPLMDRCCAMCGQMLASSTQFHKGNKWNGKRGTPCQVRGTTVTWDSMPPFLLLWSKKKLGVLLRAVCNYDPKSNKLTFAKQKAGRQVGYEEAPWLVFRPYSKNHDSKKCIYRYGKAEMLCVETPWWYCNICHSYYFSNSNDPRRVPMRNKLEGMYTRWHRDLSFVHLRPKIAELYPDLSTLPRVEEVLVWHKLRNQYIEQLRAKTGAVCPVEITQLRKRLLDTEKKWSPPPHLTAWKTPIPLRYFEQARGSHNIWKLKARAFDDLVPCEQADLMQDVKELPELEQLQSSESRSCISLCRPYGRFVDKRKEKGRGPVISTQTHQSGELYMRPLTPDEDAARGMLTGLVADEVTLQEKLR